jgi:hypothetical protein
MILFPIQIEDERFRLGIASSILTVLIFYQTAAQFTQPAIDAAAVAANLTSDPPLLVDFVLGLFRCTPDAVAAVFLIAHYWTAYGHSLERQIGTYAVVSVFLMGSILPVVLARTIDLELPEDYWFGLGGMLAMVGASYSCQFDKDVSVLYAYACFPYVMGAGRMSIPAIPITMIYHALLCIWPFHIWCIFYPFVWAAVCYTAWQVRVMIASRE